MAARISRRTGKVVDRKRSLIMKRAKRGKKAWNRGRKLSSAHKLAIRKGIRLARRSGKSRNGRKVRWRRRAA